MERTRVDPVWIDHVVFGNVMQTSGDALYARASCRLEGRRARWKCRRSPSTACVDPDCRRRSAARRLIQLGEAGIALTGGMETHDAGAARHPRDAHRVAHRNHAKLEDTLLGSAARYVLRLLDGDHRGETAR